MKPPPDRLEPGRATLGIVRTERFVRDASGRPIHPGAFPRLVDSLAPYFRSLEVAAPLVPAGEGAPEGAAFLATNVRFAPLPDLLGLRRCYLGAPRALSRLRTIAGTWDLLQLRVPDDFSPFAAAFARARRIPLYTSLVGDPPASRAFRVRMLGGAGRVLGRLHGCLQDRAYRRVLRGTLCLAHGEALARYARDAGALSHPLPSASLWDRELLPAVPPPGTGERILYVGRISPEKGLEVLIVALARARRKDLRLTLVGPSLAGYDRRLLRLAGEAGLADRLRFLGFLPLGPELFRQYRSHDLLALPSLSEGTPRVLGEGMGNGIPVLASRTGGIGDLVRHAHTGWLVPPGDPDALARALEELSANPARRARLAAEALAVSRGRTLEAVARRHFQLLEEGWPFLAAGARPMRPARMPLRAGAA